MFLQIGHEGLGRHVDPEVVDLEALALDHHAHEVLADVVHVALHRADDRLADGLVAGLDEVRLQELGPCGHGARRDQHLGHEDLSRAELVADHRHCGDKALVQDLHRVDPLVERLLDQRRDFLLLPALHGAGDVIQQ